MTLTTEENASTCQFSVSLHTVLVTDGGQHHHLSASGNFGQVIRKNWLVAVGSRMAPTEREVVSVVGPLCSPLDLLADRMELARMEAGDLVLIFQSGAYGFTASRQAFLGHPTCVEQPCLTRPQVRLPLSPTVTQYTVT